MSSPSNVLSNASAKRPAACVRVSRSTKRSPGKGFVELPSRKSWVVCRTDTADEKRAFLFLLLKWLAASRVLVPAPVEIGQLWKGTLSVRLVQGQHPEDFRASYFNSSAAAESVVFVSDKNGGSFKLPGQNRVLDLDTDSIRVWRMLVSTFSVYLLPVIAPLVVDYVELPQRVPPQFWPRLTALELSTAQLFELSDEARQLCRLYPGNALPGAKAKKSQPAPSVMMP